MGDVVGRVGRVERVEVIADGDPLIEVLEAADLGRQLRRADQEDRHQEAIVGLEVHQQPQLLEDRVVLDELGLVHDHHGVAALAEVAEEDVVELVQEVGLALRGGLLAELVEGLAQEVEGVPARIREQPDLVPLGLQALDERAGERRLAAAVLAGEHAAALAVTDRVDQPDQRLLVLGRQVEELRVRRVVERWLGELPVGFVHR